MTLFENVQFRATKLITRLKNKSYEKRLSTVNNTRNRKKQEIYRVGQKSDTSRTM